MTVYFIGGDFDRVKIGYTGDDTPARRLNDLQTGSPLPLRVLAHCPGEPEDEGALHAEFSGDRLHGEWFQATPRLVALIGYVESHKTLDSWRSAVDDPQGLADFVATFGAPSGFEGLGGMPESRVVWAGLEGRLIPPRDPPEWSLLRHAWSNVADFAPLFIESHIDRREWAPPLSCGWIQSSDGQPGVFNAVKGLEQTAAAVVEHRSGEALAAVWIQACIRDFCQRDWADERNRLRRILPHYETLLSMARGVARVEYPKMCTDTIPVPLCLPQYAVLTAEEFVRLCALNYLATAARFSIRAIWAEGAHSYWPRIVRGAVAA